MIVLAALMIADSVIGAVAGSPPFFGGVNGGFEFAVGFISLVLGASVIPSPK